MFDMLTELHESQGSVTYFSNLFKTVGPNTGGVRRLVCLLIEVDMFSVFPIMDWQIK